ncbi:MAG: class I SAM-dependent methyltransferase, partial [Acidobacteria bacterium]|nr:class I SAM-dependent methyltransferase [Acidobacteriota bacterium]
VQDEKIPGEIVIWPVPTPPEVVTEMLKLACVTNDDVVYDLGSGDGRILIEAAREYGARGVGLELDPACLRAATGNALRAGVADRVQFLQQDLFTADIGEATVVMLYLWPDVNVRLMPKLKAELKPGTRVVSQAFDIAGWEADQVVRMADRRVYLWRIPPR